MPEWKEEIRQRLANLNLEPEREAEIVEELSQHLDDRYAELLSGGATSTEAERLTLAEVRESELLAQELRRVEREVAQDPIVLGANRRSNMITDLWQDLRYGARMLRKRPGGTLIVVITLGLGIGANTMIFSMLNLFLLTRLPGIAEPDRVAQIGQTNNGQGFNSSSYADYRDYRDQTSTLAGIAAESEQQFHLGTDTTAERVKGALVSGNYFDVLGVRSAQGRLLRPSDAEIEGANPVAVISERLWRKHFGAEPDIAGKTISLNSFTYTVIGVAAGFNGTGFEKTDIWIPVTMWRHGDPFRARTGVDWLNDRSTDFVELFGRLKPGLTKEQAQAALSAIAERLGQAYPPKEAKFRNLKRGARVVALLGMSLRDRNELQQFFGLQFCIVIIVLLIACANVAGFTLARMAGRQREISVRLALGAERW